MLSLKKKVATRSGAYIGNVCNYSESVKLPADIWFIVLLFQTLLIGLILQYKVPGLPPINRAVGMVMVLLFALATFKYKIRIPIAIVIFGIYWIWAILSGMLVASDYDWLYKLIRTNVQSWFFYWVAAGLVVFRRNVDVVLVPLIISVMMIVAYGFITGDFSIDEEAFTGARQSSLVGNPNSLGIYCVLASAGVLYFWKQAGFAKRIFLLSILGLFTVAILFSGSRKSFITLLFLILFWLWFCYRNYLFRKASVFFLSILMILSMYLVSEFVMEKTTLGYRLQKSLDNPVGDVTRYGMYVEAIRLFTLHPITGVGLGNYTPLSGFGAYSHSDYAEVLSTTGGIGFIIYFSIYAFLWRGLNKVKESLNSKITDYRVGLIKAAILTIIILSMGVIVSQSIMNWILLASIAGYTHYSTNKINSELKH